MSRTGEKYFIRAREVAKKGSYDEAIALLAKIPESYCWNCFELIFKARIIQLSDNPQIYNLSDAELALHRALEVFPDNVEAFIEMGHFQSAVNDNPQIAREFFEKARDMCNHYLEEITEGLSDL